MFLQRRLPKLDHARGRDGPDVERSAHRIRRGGALAALMAFGLGLVLMNGAPAAGGIVPAVTMGTADNYSVLAGSTVTNTNESVLGQSVGLSPGTSVTGFPPGVVLAPGTIEAANATTAQAQVDLTTAYNDAAGRSVEFTVTNPDLVGQTLIPGVYAATGQGPLSLSGNLVLDGQGNADAVFIFQTDSTLITGSGSTITVINGASHCNVFWQVGSSATLGSGSQFVGNVLALTSVTVNSSATVQGRALARNGAVTLDDNTFTEPSCTPSVTTTTTPATTTTTPATTTTTPATTTTTPATTAPATTTPAGTATTTPDTTTGTTPPTTTPLPETGARTNLALATGGLLVLLGVAMVLGARRVEVATNE